MSAPARRAPGFAEFVALLAMLFATIAFSIDAMLPALPRIAGELAPGAPNRAQLIITTFVLGMGVGTLFMGPISDAVGRRPVIVGSLSLYIAAALVAGRAGSLELLLAARFVQGLGAAGPRTVTLAMVRDLYAGRAMARVMSIVLTVFLVVPAVAPSIGAGIIALSGWRGVFMAFVVFGLFSGSWLMLRQPETLPPDRRRALGLAPIVAAMREVFGSRVTLIYIAALSLGFGQMFGFISTLPQIFDEVFHRSAGFPLWFAGLAGFGALSSMSNAALVMRLGMRRLATTAFAVQVTAAAAMLAVHSGLGLAGFAPFYVWMIVSFFCIGLTFGNLNALAMEPMGHIAGLAAAVIGSVSTIGAVLIAVPIGLSYDGSVRPLVAAVLICSSLALMLMLSARRQVPAAA